MERQERRSRPADPIETLDRDACLALLSTVVIGRVAWAASGNDLKVVPVNFVLDGDSIVFRTARGGKLDAIQHGVPLVFEADDVEPALHAGWSVVLSGRAEVITDRGQVSCLEQLIGAPWAAMTEPVFVRLPLHEISGRRLPLHAGGVFVQPVEEG
ncbi:pyridoxamine 5'-phosphate oxidase family protein [Nonomuraea aurantiaca]|uniref:pyridoxamine 5'-phosphate oxidase family protein n=1 Tax=Nonomuraea aurantiaca TaxID=2878562 RepID=UPI001CD92017|nr:pyridoxamine 5'-phosphate oxidase family protein [Nonomuraea aurantiaca]MCA2229267.1 pyridoxamine 5'-phosphate oxidase family protein [Nonomuraea aurantiaca]